MEPNGRKAVDHALQAGMSARAAALICISTLAANQCAETIAMLQRVQNRLAFDPKGAK
jgi:hypothetical protein